MKKKAFTIIELIISITITIIIIWWIMVFISSLSSEIEYSTKKTNIITEISDIENKIDEIKSKYTSWIILIDNESWTGSDVLLFRKNIWDDIQDWYILAQIDFNNKVIDWSWNVDNIWKKVLGFRKISETELITIDSNPLEIYNYTFHLDNIFKNITLKDFQVSFYNSGDIWEIELYINTDYRYNNSSLKYSEITNENIEKFIFNF